MNQLPDSKTEVARGAKAYRRDILVRFSDCDPAGIVFYPKYFEMFNTLIEDWCRDELNFSFNEIVARRGWGLPTVHLAADFFAPSSFGETLHGVLHLRKLGTTSITLEITLRGADGVLRVGAKSVLVLIDRAVTRPIPFPAEVRERLSALLDQSPEKTATEHK